MAVIDAKKLLPPSKKSGAIEKQKVLIPLKSISVNKVSAGDLKPVDKESKASEDLSIIKRKIIQIDVLLRNSYLIDKKNAETKRKEEERKRSEKREKNLEDKVKKNQVSSNLIPSIPGQSIFDKINRFIGFTLLGYLFNKYGELLPKLLEFGKILEPVGKFVEGFAKNLLKGVVDFIEFGYKAYDQSRDFVKQIGGEGAQKTFDEFSKNLNLMLNGAIGAALLIASTAPKKPGRDGGRGYASGYAAGYAAGVASRAKAPSGSKYRSPGQAAAGRTFGENLQRQKLTKERMLSPTGPKGPLDKISRGFKGAAAQLETGTLFKRGAGIQKGLYNLPKKLKGFKLPQFKLPKIPGLSQVGKALGPLKKLGKLGKIIPGLATVIGITEGLFRLGEGDYTGALLSFGTAIPIVGWGFLALDIVRELVGKESFDNTIGINKKSTQGRAEGGTVSKPGQSTVSPTRRLKTKPRKVSPKIQPQTTQPGKDVGGKLKIEGLYGKDEPGKRSALRALKKSSEDIKKMRSINGLAGSMFGAGIDMTLGQKPDKKLAKSIGDVFGSVVQNAVDAELNSSFGDISKTIAMANGGVVPSREIGRSLNIGERIGKFISNALAISIESSASRILQNLNRELNLEGEGAAPDGLTGPTGPIEYGPLPLNMTQKQAFATIYELAKKHNASMPELVAAMAMNESGYLSSVLARQYNNPFGQTGSGTKGSTKIPGNSRTFAVYNSLSDAVKFHVEKWNNDSSYGKGAGTYASPVEGLRAILPIYDPGGNHSQYIKNASSILSTMGFDPQKKNPKADLSNQRLIQQRRPLSGGVVPGQPGQQPQPVSGNVKDTGLKDSSGRPIRFKGIIADAFIDMAAAARKDGVNLGNGISSSYRSLEDQKRVYQQKYGRDWQKYMVWNSRHMTGEAFDINWSSAAGIWIRNNASRFGFRFNTYSGESTHFDWVGGYSPKSSKPAAAKPKPPASPPPPAGPRNNSTRAAWNPSQSGLKFNSKTGAWEKASLGPTSLDLARGLDVPSYERVENNTIALQHLIVS